MPTFRHDGVSLYDEEYGRGEPLILLHGLTPELGRDSSPSPTSELRASGTFRISRSPGCFIPS